MKVPFTLTRQSFNIFITILIGYGSIVISYIFPEFSDAVGPKKAFGLG